MAGIVSYHARHSPKQSGIAQDIRRRIMSGEYPPGAQLPSVARLQERYGVTPLTVRRAVGYLSEHGFLFTKARAGIYVSPDPPCLSNFGFVRPFLSAPSQFVTAVENELRMLCDAGLSPSGIRRRFSVFEEVDCSSQQAEHHHRELVSAVEGGTVAGLFFYRAPYRFSGTAVLRNPTMPRVTMGEEPMPGMIVVSLLPGFYGHCLKYLAARGRRRVAIITIANREDGFVQERITEVRAHGLTTHRRWVQGVSPDVLRWATNVAELLLDSGGANRPDAIIIDDDNLVPAATAGIAAAGVRVPDDLDVVAHTNFPWPTPSAVPVARLGTDVRRLIRAVVNLIERQRAGKDVPDIVELPTCSEAEVLPPGTDGNCTVV